ncbi:hypothetical protein N9948_01035 [bacterium]|nr:hypothetical protein [bacterium]
MSSSDIINKVKSKLNKKARDMEFKTSDIDLQYFQDALQKRYLDEIKDKWNLSKIDMSELDWEWEKIDLKWHVNLPRSSATFNVQIVVPDQMINVKGGVSYTDENDKDHDFDFNDDFEFKDLKANFKDLKVHNSDIAPQEVDWSSKEVDFGS